LTRINADEAAGVAPAAFSPYGTPRTANHETRRRR
jgi:hypothetical protein